MKKISSATAWMVIFVLVILVALLLVRTNQSSTAISFNQFQKSWLSNNIKSFQLGEDKMTVRGSLKNGTQYETIVPSERLFQFIGQHPKDGQVQEMYAKPATIPMWVQYLPTILLVLVLVAVWFMFMQQSQGGGGNRGVMNFGKSRAKMATPDKQKVTFDDVAGAEEEKQELAEIVDFLKQPKRYIEMGARIPKGVLLVGPPGTGKTLLAKAISGEAGVPFFSISGSDFVEMFVGVGASRVRDLFDQAKKNSPCIVFIDEIDAVGRQRGAGLGGGHDEREQTLNQLLVEMDGFGQNEGIIMIAATNRPDILDPALLRPGRFDRQILVGAPDVKGREEILNVHSKNKHLSDEVKLDVLAKRTPGFTGADLENLMNEAALLAVRKNKSVVEMEELEEAVTRVVAGPEKKSRVIDEEDRKLTAYHEAGHAVVMQLLPTSDPVHEISIIPRGMAGGYTMHLPEKDTSYMSKTKLEEEIIGLLGGRVAEKIIIGDISTGAKNDIERATTIARKMVMDYGMSGLGPIAFGSGHDEVFLGRDLGKGRNFSEEVAFEIDKEIRKLIDNGYKRAEKLLTDNINKLHAVAKRLLEKEKVEADEFLEIFNQA
ncbi:ATP-dependent zinc metalloprotease FtsH [Clostridium tyrobutyricum]|jgi:cell division protease FtsH|uniref:ATP-dependent zinc metalloprotease FtsH n=1 Tax=Clostridium tyrobutyricum DIVETGP TaxID=1408889 RepID=W6N7B5_CLOTY|nr:ATP-dependent zinc metalloprotease FtsH [Clostridium tyrobutyricum]AND86170.1 ATP-dependent zinc metalloprotease FtsH [Clostridium tyrobutyricum]ANP70665.1 cell division protein FtsH [Clostridium tyrobutyricum]MBV4435145.1 ATP-dependent zinc metalloprotease FtsH [Clostridium tyrobutyricum]MBV4446994.1 ATP-dependent zinc metalloprotease FtsH [Clostridium tyrobutyricum]QCH28825.1 ATP-dependent zinc metalloprotease FtsH [Clostridium tyrobutyricum]